MDVSGRVASGTKTEQCKASRSESSRHIIMDRRGVSEDLGTPLRGAQHSNVLDSAINQRFYRLHQCDGFSGSAPFLISK